MSLHHPVALHTSSSPYMLSALQLSHGQGPMWNHQGQREMHYSHGSRGGIEPSTLNYRSDEYPRHHWSGNAQEVVLANGGVSARKPPSRARHQSWDMDSLHRQPRSHIDPPALSSSWTSQLVRPSSRRGSKSSPMRGPRNGFPRVEQEHLDSKVAMIGSWCNTDLTHAIVSPKDLFEYEKDALLDDWHPRTPRECRLSTPDLAPLCMDYEFCACCQNEDDRINETWYMTSKVKMEDQCMLRG
ncbi:hypothetical protein AUP68_15596 [Ilyonectria robusta]